MNAYGLTETSSTIAVLGPDDHRAAFASDDPAVRARLGSVGRPLPGVELSIREPEGEPGRRGEVGEIWVRGEQVSGEYLGVGGAAVEDGWFNTRDGGGVDDEGYLFVQGRLDDVIVRGGENLSPGEIEAVLVEHPGRAEAAVVGIPDVEWGERVVAAVVLEPDVEAGEDELRDHVRACLRSARTPERIEFRDELPFNETGKLLPTSSSQRRRTEGRRGQGRERPGGRRRGARGERRRHARVLYFGLGDRDAYWIIDLPDKIGAKAIAMAVGAAGMASVQTTVLLTAEEIDRAAATKVDYTPPGGLTTGRRVAGPAPGELRLARRPRDS